MLSGCLFTIGAIFIFIGIVVFVTNRGGQAEKPQNQASSNPLKQIQSIFTTATQPPAAPSASVGAAAGQTSMPSASNDPKPLEWIRPGIRIRVQHPQQGELTLYVMGQIDFSELWQRRPGADVPWTPTGNVFTGYWLETNRFLLNWQNRYYLLDEATATSDPEIQRDFSSHARQFAQSNQTANVYFAYPPAMWHIDDIGKFQVARIMGEGFSQQMNAIGRFIHASGDSERALVLEDFEGGGGQDMVWIGYKITADVVQPG